MKIKRPLLNQFYEEDRKETEDQKNEPLERPSFAYIKPLEQASKELTNAEIPQEVIIQTRPSEEFLRKKAQLEAETKAKLESDALALKQAQERAEQERIALEELKQHELEQKRLLEQARAQTQAQLEPALPKTAVRADQMPQQPQIVKKRTAILPSEDQLEFGITPKKATLQQRLQFLKLYFVRRQELLEISMLWKDPAVPFNIISTLFVAGILFIGGIFEFEKIPLKIPLFYNHVEKSWEQTDKSALFIIGTILLLIEGFLLNLIIKIFKSDRRLALTLSWVITFINVLVIIASLQIYSLVT